MAELSKWLPLTASCLSPLYRQGAWEKVASDLRLGIVFHLILRFLKHLQLASHDLAATMAENVTKIEISNTFGDIYILNIFSHCACRRSCCYCFCCCL